MKKTYVASDYYARFDELNPGKPLLDSFTPGSKRRNFAILGDGSTEGGANSVNIDTDIGLTLVLRKESGKGNATSTHYHHELEFFLVLYGTYKFMSGYDEKTTSAVLLNRYDFMLVPPNVVHSFEEMDDHSLVFAAVPDRKTTVFWAPKVFEDAEGRGLLLLSDGTLIDTTKGYKVPAGAKTMPIKSQEEFISRTTIADEKQLEAHTFRYHSAKWIRLTRGLQVVYAVGGQSAKYDFQLKHECEFNVYLFKLFIREKLLLQNSHHTALIMFEGEVNITLHLEDSDHTILVKERDTLVIPEGVKYDLDLITNEAQYYMIVMDKQSSVDFR
ncbi:MAG: hypothetical protein Q8L78_06795 [Coxiellaceae bacterium]|nr:hypothetical protein [Coxiellaceae bacterium]